MGKNTGNGYRRGPISNRSQSFNPKTGQYIKFDTETGKILSCSKNKYKNVRTKTKSKSVTSAKKINTKTKVTKAKVTKTKISSKKTAEKKSNNKKKTKSKKV